MMKLGTLKSSCVMPKGSRACDQTEQDPPHSNVEEGVKILYVDT
jgi:hypothetical protein